MLYTIYYQNIQPYYIMLAMSDKIGLTSFMLSSPNSKKSISKRDNLFRIVTVTYSYFL